VEYNETKPGITLNPFIHAFWELKGDENDNQWERNFPDGCAGLVMNLGDTCLTDNGSVSMEFGKTYVVGAMTSFKDSFVNSNTHLVGVCLKPAAFTNFYNYEAQNELLNQTVEFTKSHSFDVDKIMQDSSGYLNQFFTNNIRFKNMQLELVLADIHHTKGLLSIYELSKRHYTTVRQLERNFKIHVGISPKEYSNIIRFQHALSIIKNPSENRSFSAIAFECGFYDHSHLTNEIKRNTGLSPSQL
jgi:AraC-like DNA-binding protein